MRQDLELVDQFLIELPAALIVREEPLPVGRRTERVPADQHGARPFGLVQAQQEIGEPDDRAAARLPVRRIDFGRAG